MVNNVVSDGLCLGVQLHNRFLEHVHLVLHVGLLLVHPLALGLRLGQRLLEHVALLGETSKISLDKLDRRLKVPLLELVLVELFVEFLGNLLLFLGLVADARDFTLRLKNFVVLLLNEVLDGLKRLVSLLHSE